MQEKILKQVNFYFSDANFFGDKFLQEQSKKEDGWIPISVIASFKRMQQISEDLDQIVDCIVESKSDIFEVNKETKCIRKKNLDSSNFDITKLSLLSTGFPLDATLDEILDFMGSLAKVSAVRLGRDKSAEKNFSGTATIVFDDETELNKVLALSNEIMMRDSKIAFSVKTGNKRKADQFVYGRILKLEGVPEGVMEVDVKLKMKEIVPEVQYVKRLPDGVYSLLREPIVDTVVEKFKENPLVIGDENTSIVVSKIDDCAEEKRIIEQLEIKGNGRSNKNKKRRVLQNQ